MSIAPLSRRTQIPPVPQLRYRNNSNYKHDTEIRKRAFVSPAVLDELKRIIHDSEVSLSCANLMIGIA